jgi:DNA-binding CsgD family transcriptional regulator
MLLLEHKSPSDKEVAEHLARHTFRMLGGVSVTMAELTPHGTVHAYASDGLRSAASKRLVENDLPLTSDIPIVEALRNNRLVWLTDMQAMGVNYPDAADIAAQLPVGTIIAWPISRPGGVAGAIAIYSPDILFPNPTTEAFLRTVSNLLSLFNNLAQPVQSNNGPSPIQFLTDRQVQVLERISHGDTNAQIASLIGYSESTVRQETIRLFQRLGVANRREAREFYIAHRSEFEHNHH